MRRHARYSIAALRKWRRAFSVVVAPAFALWSLSAATCFGMPLQIGGDEMPVVMHVDHAVSAPHAAHGAADDMHEHAGMPDCAHCPPAADDGQSTPAICLTDGASNANGAKSSATPDLFKLLTQSRLPPLSWASAPPPLIGTAVVSDAPHVEHTPLNIRHCVFLI
jgi:hypothetical protein